METTPSDMGKEKKMLHKKDLELMERNSVVITGMGIWSCLGTNLDEVCRSQPASVHARGGTICLHGYSAGFGKCQA